MSEQATPLLSDEDLAYKLGAWSINRVGGDEVSIDLHLEIYDFACDIRDDMQTALDAASERVVELEAERDGLYQELARHVHEEIECVERRAPGYTHRLARLRYKVLTGRDYDEGSEGDE